ncbi:MAG: hypothetical protein ACFB3T_14610 [Geminicoccaceae bacterium]
MVPPEVYLIGTEAADNIEGTDANEYIDGMGGDDRFLRGHGGDDEIFGGEGRDQINGGTGTNILRGGNGNDIYWYDVGGGLDHIYEAADEGYDTVRFWDAEDGQIGVRWAANARDIVFTVDGVDAIIVHDFVDGGRLEAVEGDIHGWSWTLDELSARLGPVPEPQPDPRTVIDGTDASDNIMGSEADEVINGYAGDDLYLRGGGGDDVINGGAGDDQINGGSGTNELRGGTGDDVYWHDLADGVNHIHENAGEGFDTLRFYDASKVQIGAYLGANDSDAILTIDGQDAVIIHDYLAGGTIEHIEGDVQGWTLSLAELDDLLGLAGGAGGPAEPTEPLETVIPIAIRANARIQGELDQAGAYDIYVLEDAAPGLYVITQDGPYGAQAPAHGIWLSEVSGGLLDTPTAHVFGQRLFVEQAGDVTLTVDALLSAYPHSPVASGSYAFNIRHIGAPDTGWTVDVAADTPDFDLPSGGPFYWSDYIAHSAVPLYDSFTLHAGETVQFERVAGDGFSPADHFTAVDLALINASGSVVAQAAPDAFGATSLTYTAPSSATFWLRTTGEHAGKVGLAKSVKSFGDDVADSMVEAVDLGTLSALDTVANVTSSGDADWFKLNLASAGELTVRFSDHLASGGILEHTDVSLFDASGNALASSDAFGSWDKTVTGVSAQVAAGEVFVQVASDALASVFDYAVHFEMTPGVV